MLINQRHQQILDYLKKNQFATTKKLANEIFVSESTIRRDLVIMQKQQLIKRVRGGASALESPTTESSILIRKQVQVKEKRKIAIKCLDYIKDGNSYFLDSSSSVGELITFLNNYNDLTIITNGINNALILASYNKFQVYLTPGHVLNITNSTVGYDTNNYISKFNCNMFIFSCSGISLNGGITEASVEQRDAKKQMLKESNIHILLVDHTKFGKIFLAKTCEFNKIDILITDRKPDEIYLETFKKNNIKVLYSEEE